MGRIVRWGLMALAGYLLLTVLVAPIYRGWQVQKLLADLSLELRGKPTLAARKHAEERLTQQLSARKLSGVRVAELSLELTEGVYVLAVPYVVMYRVNANIGFETELLVQSNTRELWPRE